MEKRNMSFDRGREKRSMRNMRMSHEEGLVFNSRLMDMWGLTWTALHTGILGLGQVFPFQIVDYTCIIAHDIENSFQEEMVCRGSPPRGRPSTGRAPPRGPTPNRGHAGDHRSATRSVRSSRQGAAGAQRGGAVRAAPEERQAVGLSKDALRAHASIMSRGRLLATRKQPRFLCD
jgi:hypothetical protein